MRLRHQRPAEQHAAAPAARQLAHPAVGGQRQTRHDQLHLLFEPPAVTLLERMLQLSETFEIVGMMGLRHTGRGLVVVGNQAAEIAEPGCDFREHRAVDGHRHVLIEARDPQPGLAPERAGIDRLIARQDAQQAALSRPVPADQRDALAVVDLKIGILEKRQMSERESGALQGKKGHEQVRTDDGRGRPRLRERGGGDRGGRSRRTRSPRSRPRNSPARRRASSGRLCSTR